MGVMPLEKISHVFVGDSEQHKTEVPSISELGRLHFTKSELTQLGKKERLNAMAFKLIDVDKLPKREFARAATEPKISITDGGRFMFNALIKKQWDGMGKMLVSFDSDTNRLQFRPFKSDAKVKDIDPSKFVKLAYGKGKAKKDGTQDHNISASGAGILDSVGYKYADAGNQSFPVEYVEKGNMYVLTLPKETPAKRPTVVRKSRKKVEPTVQAGTAPTQAVNGADKSAPPVAPAEDEIAIEL